MCLDHRLIFLMETLAAPQLSRIPEPSDFQRAMMTIMPPLKKRLPSPEPSQHGTNQYETMPTMAIAAPGFLPGAQLRFTGIPQMAPASQQAINDHALQQKLDHKERNRIAAQKWRAKKDECLSTLEEENDVLRKKVFDLQAQALQLSTENNVLESELQYFQQFMSRIMFFAPKK